MKIGKTDITFHRPQFVKDKWPNEKDNFYKNAAAP